MPETTAVFHEVHKKVTFRHSISITFDFLQVPTTTTTLVTRKREIEVEPTYQPIIRFQTCRLFSEEIVGRDRNSSLGVHNGVHKGVQIGGPGFVGTLLDCIIPVEEDAVRTRVQETTAVLHKVHKKVTFEYNVH